MSVGSGSTAVGPWPRRVSSETAEPGRTLHFGALRPTSVFPQPASDRRKTSLSSAAIGADRAGNAIDYAPWTTRRPISSCYAATACYMYIRPINNNNERAHVSLAPLTSLPFTAVCGSGSSTFYHPRMRLY